MSDKFEPQSEKDQSLSRRELLKALAATAGATAAAAFLPGSWVKPVVKAGVLPAHAQGTMQYELDCDIFLGEQNISNQSIPAGNLIINLRAQVQPPTAGVGINFYYTYQLPAPGVGSLNSTTLSDGSCQVDIAHDFQPDDTLNVVVSIYSPAGQTATCSRFVSFYGPR